MSSREGTKIDVWETRDIRASERTSASACLNRAAAAAAGCYDDRAPSNYGENCPGKDTL